MRLLLAILLMLPLIFSGGVAGLAALPTAVRTASCEAPGVAVDVTGAPLGPVAGYTGDQLTNAALIIAAGHSMGVPAHAQVIAVMTAMGESGLRVLDYGDAVGPDSRGLFQQRDNGAWGSYADRMDPTASARNFYTALLAVDGWQGLPPTIAAHRTQRNADPYHYERFWSAATQVVDALSTSATPVLGLGCGNPSGEVVAATGWTKPALGPVTSGFGYRIHPVTGVPRLHTGTDIGAACDAPIYAAAAGVVVTAGPAGGYGNLVVVDHGGAILTRYGHMYNDGLLARVGDQVAAGQQIARIGSFGLSTGCHLHVEVMQDGEFVDPASFLAARGVPL